MDTTDYPAIAALIEHCEELQEVIEEFLGKVNDDELAQKDLKRLKIFLDVADRPSFKVTDREYIYGKEVWEQVNREISDCECERDRAEEEQAQQAEKLRQQDLADYWQMTAGSLATSNGC